MYLKKNHKTLLLSRIFLKQRGKRHILIYAKQENSNCTLKGMQRDYSILHLYLVCEAKTGDFSSLSQIIFFL